MAVIDGGEPVEVNEPAPAEIPGLARGRVHGSRSRTAITPSGGRGEPAGTHPPRTQRTSASARSRRVEDHASGRNGSVASANQ